MTITPLEKWQKQSNATRKLNKIPLNIMAASYSPSQLSTPFSLAMEQRTQNYRLHHHHLLDPVASFQSYDESSFSHSSSDPSHFHSFPKTRLLPLLFLSKKHRFLQLQLQPLHHHHYCYHSHHSKPDYGCF
ncbi:hypothetical protein Hanom_Chr15g01377351 [Helianthus anomalus]